MSRPRASDELLVADELRVRDEEDSDSPEWETLLCSIEEPWEDDPD